LLGTSFIVCNISCCPADGKLVQDEGIAKCINENLPIWTDLPEVGGKRMEIVARGWHYRHAVLNHALWERTPVNVG
jgi:hypothetical protein